MCEFSSSLLWWFGRCFNEIHCNQYQVGSCGTQQCELNCRDRPRRMKMQIVADVPTGGQNSPVVRLLALIKN